MKNAATILITCVAASVSYGTEQVTDRLLIEGKSHQLCSTPLEDYFDEKNPRPRELHPVSTGCWRGYIGTWKIESNALYLLRLHRDSSSTTPETEIPLDVVFKDRRDPSKRLGIPVF